METVTSRVRMTTPAGETWEVLLDKPVFLVGRGEKCDIRIQDRTLSRVHARMARDPDGQYRISDQESQNGVFFHGKRLQQEMLMVAGQTFLLGDVSLQFLQEVTPIADPSMTMSMSKGTVPAPRTMVPILPAEESEWDDAPTHKSVAPQLLATPPSTPQVKHDDQTVFYDEEEAEYQLEVVAGPQKGVIRECNTATLVIGRALECDFVMEDPTVSRKHAMIFRDAGKLVITGQQDASGKLYVNGEVISRQVLKHKDRIRLGKTQMVFTLKDPPPEEPVAPMAPIIQPHVEVRVNAPAPAANRGPLWAGLAGVAVLLAGLLWLDPMHWFRSRLEVQLAEIAQMERDLPYKASSAYDELLQRETGLSREKKQEILEKRGWTDLAYGVTLLDGGDLQGGMNHFQKSLEAFQTGEAPVRARMLSALLKFAGQALDKGEDRRAQQVVEWLRHHRFQVQDSHEFQEVAGRAERFGQARQVREEALALVAKGEADGAVRLLERCVQELDKAGEPCRTGQRELARRWYDQSLVWLQEAEAKTGRDKGKQLEETVRLLERASRLDPQNTLIREAQADTQRRKGVHQSQEAGGLFQGDGFVLDKFRR